VKGSEKPSGQGRFSDVAMGGCRYQCYAQGGNVLCKHKRRAGRGRGSIETVSKKSTICKLGAHQGEENRSVGERRGTDRAGGRFIKERGECKKRC